MGAIDFKVVIPARYASTRLPGKALRLMVGRPMLQHVCERANESSAQQVVIATDDRRIAEAASGFNATVCMTSEKHTSGTERLAEVVEQLGWSDDTLVVNLQGDEPAMPAALIDQVAADMAAHKVASIATLACPLGSTENEINPDIVKVVLDREGYALYFSRAPIPWHRDGSGPAANVGSASPVLHHIGLYAYRAQFLRHFSELEHSPLEIFEKLEQLRALWHGKKVHVGITGQMPASGVDTEADLLRVEKLL
jgi:3-deoxy-manno-octulosonate cytidylyltransferase (CMP-KDO synthetase)